MTSITTTRSNPCINPEKSSVIIIKQRIKGVEKMKAGRNRMPRHGIDYDGRGGYPPNCPYARGPPPPHQVPRPVPHPAMLDYELELQHVEID
ncbi:hypothetical protein MKW98_009100 [Papaver atlanticum]|uniref:Uncharacterized protein n=1 Tax=Papaver atlanticum TaxID=357466 RepID=A0AAD4XSX9_9MAGN|nr:hypothetical protein MKW98_009100 [Papaver atlanticum]